MLVRTLKGHTRAVLSVAWSPDGQKIASASSDHRIKIWDIETYLCLSTMSGHINNVKSVVWSPNGQKIASSSDDTTIKLWDAETSLCLSTLSGHLEGVECCLVTRWTENCKWIY